MIIKNKLETIFDGEFEYINSGNCRGEYNMKFDMERAEQLAKGVSLPIFRLYGWEPWALSLGYNQKDDMINYDECKRFGYDVVRRPTGGRAVFHSNELTYCVVVKLNNGKTMQDVYREIHVFLLDCLQQLGSGDLDFEKSQPDFKEFYKQSASVSCFASSARYEIMSKGKKVVGSAQRVFDNVLLQHGSILLGDEHLKLIDLIKVESEKEKSVLKKYMETHSVSLQEVFGKSINCQDCVKLIENKIN